MIAWTGIFALRRREGTDGLRLCSRCSRLHGRTEAIASAADGVAVGALAFLIALPFVAAGYESGFTLSGTALGISAVVAVIAAAAEANFLARAAAGRVWPRLRWRTGSARIIGGGARWVGTPLAVYIFQPGPGVVKLFGGVGKRLVLDLASTWTIWAAATLLVLAVIAALATRWLIPLALHSLPTTLAARSEPRGTPG